MAYNFLVKDWLYPEPEHFLWIKIYVKLVVGRVGHQGTAWWVSMVVTTDGWDRRGRLIIAPQDTSIVVVNARAVPYILIFEGNSAWRRRTFRTINFDDFLRVDSSTYNYWTRVSILVGSWPTRCSPLTSITQDSSTLRVSLKIRACTIHRIRSTCATSSMSFSSTWHS
jgi:hypothetical protein